MTFFTYNTNIPAANNNPSTDQPDMLTNTNAIDSILNVDHFSFNNNNGGMHQQVQLFSQNTIPAGTNNTPAGLKAGSGTIYTKPLGGPSDIYYTPDQSGNEYQLTKTISAQFAKFGLNNNGWTFLPGNLILQYGQATITGTNTTVNFPFVFPTGLISLTATLLGVNVNGITWAVGNANATSFVFHSSDATARPFSWMAIGK